MTRMKGYATAGIMSICLLLSSGCRALSEKLSDTPTVSSKQNDSKSSIKLAEGMTPQLQFEQVRQRPLARTLTVTGKVQFNEDVTARVLAPLPGQVVDLPVRVGDRVERDQALLAIRSREVASLVTEYLEGHRDLEFAEKTFNMTKDLFDHQASSRIALQQSESELEKARARFARGAEALQIYGIDPREAERGRIVNPAISVRSPISGTVIERAVTTGQFVQPESGPLLVVADLNTVWVLADVFERDIRHVRPGLRANVTTAAYPDGRFTARVARIHDAVDSESRTVKVRFLVNNPEGRLKPEMFATVSLFLNESEPALAIPTAAAFTEGGSNFVYVRGDESCLSRRRVETGGEVAGLLRVTQGLRTGETVVTKGVMLIRQMEQNRTDND